MDFIVNNMGTIVVGVMVLGVLGAIVLKMVSDKKKGKTSCSCGCGSCPNAGNCHSMRKKCLDS